MAGFIVTKNKRGFRETWHPKYPTGVPGRLLTESSAVREYDDALDNPGSSALWIGDDWHLNREEVEELILHLNTWLKTKRLTPPTEKEQEHVQGYSK